nr:M20/M25/M40 family metallo-hydrolase [Texcoconibacillus texcoconensis]
MRELVCELVGWESVTLSDGERVFPYKLRGKLLGLDYFNKRPEAVSLHGVDEGRSFLTAVYEHDDAKKTVVLMSHFDTVQTDEYGGLEPLATQPDRLTEALGDRKDVLPKAARADLESRAYLFGRGTMDMKGGLALHMSLLEKASVEGWPINLVLLTVPDEEVNSAGMRAATRELVRLRKKHRFDYSLFLNSEPSFAQGPGDETHYFYTGTMGKMMPAALIYGKETHVGEPLRGMTANYIASFLTQRIEWNDRFRETIGKQSTPLPVSLSQKDLKFHYSTQTPYRATALYNVFIMKKNASDVLDLFVDEAEKAAKECNTRYKSLCEREQVAGVGDVQVLRYEKLLRHAQGKFGKKKVDAWVTEVTEREDFDDRDKSLAVADKLMTECSELAPAIVVLFAPPYYPAVNTSDDPKLLEWLKQVKDEAGHRGVDLAQTDYFNGICDLSYVNGHDGESEMQAYKENTPVWGRTYEIPFDMMAKLQAPVLNLGPFGKDAHQRTERLHMDNAFVHTRAMLERLLRSMF